MNKSYNELLDYYKDASNEEIILDMMQDYDISLSKLQQENKQLKERIEKALNKNQYIIDYGFDYDGFNKVKSLKGLIDMLVDYAVQVKHILGDKE